MFIYPRLDLFLLVLLLSTPQVSARQKNAPSFPADGKIHLDVVVTAKSGPPLSDLHLQDFTVLDNEVPQAIRSFEAVDGRRAPVEVVLLIDVVNTRSENLDMLRDGIDRFLKADEGRLTYPTMVAILTNEEIQFQEDFSQDGNAISTALDQRATAIRSISLCTDSYGAAARFQISLQGLRRLVARESGRPGRKLILWLSPGLPVLSGSQRMDNAKQEQQVFGDLVDISTQLREFHITLYTVDPFGISDAGARASNLEPYLKGVSKPSEVRRGDFALQVIATQSGGLALTAGNDIAAELQQCIADAGAYYQISFEPATTDRVNEYHHLEIRVANAGLTARTWQGYYSRPWRAGNIGVEFEEAGMVRDNTLRENTRTEDATVMRSSDSLYEANPHPDYLDAPLAQLVERIPELKTLQPAPDQQVLPRILQKMGGSEDDFVRDVGDLIAHEYVTQEKVNAKGDVKAKASFQDDYLILHHGNEWGANAEYRMNKKGKRLGPVGLERGFLVTSGWALSCIAFSTAVQSQSKFRYLGEDKIGSLETYVLGFAQQPGTTFMTTMALDEGLAVDMLTQGILWVDKNSFQIIRMRTDILGQRNEIILDQLTTEVTFAGVQLHDVPNPLWLPSDVDVYIGIKKQKFRNVHHYTNYQRYRAAVKIGDSQ
jgi:VWFA-related protein